MPTNIERLLAVYDLFFGKHPRLKKIISDFNYMIGKVVEKLGKEESSYVIETIENNTIPKLNNFVLKMVQRNEVGSFSRSRAAASFFSVNSISGGDGDDLSLRMVNDLIEYILDDEFAGVMIEEFFSRVYIENYNYSGLITKEKVKAAFREILCKGLIDNDRMNEGIALFMKLHPKIDRETMEMVTIVQEITGEDQ